MKTKEEVYEVLRSKGIQFEAVDHPAVFTMEDMEREIHRDLSEVVKNVFLRDEKKKHWYLVVIPKDKSLDMVKLKDVIGSTRLSFAREDYLMERLGLEKGAVTPLGILNDPDHIVEVIIDAEVAAKPRIGIHPCDNTATVWMDYADLAGLIRANGNSLRLVRL